MSKILQIPLTGNVCRAVENYAEKHISMPPKTAIISCEGACLRGEIARRAANMIAYDLASDLVVRICIGGLLGIGGGMKRLVENSNGITVLDGCAMVCGSRITRSVFPDRELDLIIIESLTEIDRNLFGMEEMEEEEIKLHTYRVAGKITKNLISKAKWKAR